MNVLGSLYGSLSNHFFPSASNTSYKYIALVSANVSHHGQCQLPSVHSIHNVITELLNLFRFCSFIFRSFFLSLFVMWMNYWLAKLVLFMWWRLPFVIFQAFNSGELKIFEWLDEQFSVFNEHFFQYSFRVWLTEGNTKSIIYYSDWYNQHFQFH